MPAWVLPAIAGVSAALGFIGDKKATKQAQSQFDSQMDTSVQRRVQDAKKAGVHPLFALGGSAGATPTTFTSGGRDRYGDLGRTAVDAVGAYQTAKAAPGIAAQQAGLAQAQIKRDLGAAARDETQAQLNLSNIARLTQGSADLDGLGVQIGPEGITKVTPPEIMTTQPKNPGIEAGIRPGTIDVKMQDGSKINILSPELNMDEIAQVDYAAQRIMHKSKGTMFRLLEGMAATEEIGWRVYQSILRKLRK